MLELHNKQVNPWNFGSQIFFNYSGYMIKGFNFRWKLTSLIFFTSSLLMT